MFGSDRESGNDRPADDRDASVESGRRSRSWVQWLTLSSINITDNRMTSLAVQAGKVFLLVGTLLTVYHVVN